MGAPGLPGLTSPCLWGLTKAVQATTHRERGNHGQEIDEQRIVKTLKTVVLVVLLIPIALLLVSLFLPSRYRVERSTLIRARPEAIFTTVNTPKKWPEWTAWTPA